jgi:hypothetical protein
MLRSVLTSATDFLTFKMRCDSLMMRSVAASTALKIDPFAVACRILQNADLAGSFEVFR